MPDPAHPYCTPHHTLQFVFLGPTPVLLLVWFRGEWVMWYYTAFAVPSIIFSAIIMPFWSKQDMVRRGMAVHRVKVIQWYVKREFATIG